MLETKTTLQRLLAIAAMSVTLVFLSGTFMPTLRPQAASQPEAKAAVQTSSDVIYEDHHDTSMKLRDLARLLPSAQLRPLEMETPVLHRNGPPFISTEPDPVLQTAAKTKGLPF